MIKIIDRCSYLPVNFSPDFRVDPPITVWWPKEGDQVYYRNKLYIVVDTETDMGGSRTIAIVRIHKTRNNFFPWAHIKFFRDVDFHMLTLPIPYGITTDLGHRA